jgi:serine/threonine protein kinase
VYTSSTLQDGTSSATGDESSISTTAGRCSRKKRSQSTDPHRKKKSQRKVAVNDFEMMRVLGKGCAGKVLLVRHKMSSDLYALKAITKRHVLAHQELQHTLTEQAVLKRMSKEAKDPFVVKLWWSFHDKENLFLVMVNQCFLYTRTPLTLTKCRFS